MQNETRRIVMNIFAKSALVLGAVGTIAIGSMTASEARSGRWVAGAAGFAVGAAVGAAAANAAAYNSGYYYGGPAYAYAPGYDAYAYAPGYTYAPAPAYTYAPAPAYGYYGPDISTQSAPRHYDSSFGYNSNTLSPWQDRKMQGSDY
jgi:hypothetical protein